MSSLGWTGCDLQRLMFKLELPSALTMVASSVEEAWIQVGSVLCQPRMVTMYFKFLLQPLVIIPLNY